MSNTIKGAALASLLAMAGYAIAQQAPSTSQGTGGVTTSNTTNTQGVQTPSATGMSGSSTTSTTSPTSQGGRADVGAGSMPSSANSTTTGAPLQPVNPEQSGNAAPPQSSSGSGSMSGSSSSTYGSGTSGSSSYGSSDDAGTRAPRADRG